MKLRVTFNQKESYLSLGLTKGSSLENLLRIEVELFLVNLMMLSGRPDILFSIFFINSIKVLSILLIGNPSPNYNNN